MIITKDKIISDIIEHLEENNLSISLDDIIKINNILGLYCVNSKSYHGETIDVN